MPDVLNPNKIKMTKTYSISVGDVTRLKEVGEFLGVSDAEALHRAVALLYKDVFPNSDKKDVSDEAQ